MDEHVSLGLIVRDLDVLYGDGDHRGAGVSPNVSGDLDASYVGECTLDVSNGDGVLLPVYGENDRLDAERGVHALRDNVKAPRHSEGDAQRVARRN